MPTFELQKICNECDSFRDLLRALGYKVNSGTMWKNIKERIKQDNIDTSHFYKKTAFKHGQIPMEEILVKNSTFNRGHLKKRLIKEGLIKYICSGCGNNGIWLNKSLTLQIDHKNGDSLDNRLENLEFLCPNCHSQTDTFSGRNVKKKIKKENIEMTNKKEEQRREDELRRDRQMRDEEYRKKRDDDDTSIADIAIASVVVSEIMSD